ncbi:hypothetical protein EYF80_027211 [Liparis tanakae]|uniref:Uncharacterized protein n=1 Tax=Liparis tanakae TaxID=230148 RepID=A0A4Z2HCV4_9TELE|nr:hypothetical protein EYF80_027211 [Liparis tanakae]
MESLKNKRGGNGKQNLVFGVILGDSGPPQYLEHGLHKAKNRNSYWKSSEHTGGESDVPQHHIMKKGPQDNAEHSGLWDSI